jgi:hypothetical protein
MKKLLKFFLLAFAICFVLALFFARVAFAASDFDVDWGVADGNPIFTVVNMLPGDSESRSINITNNGSVSHPVKVKGIRTGGIGANPKLETILDIVIKDGPTFVYGAGSPTGPKKLSSFFAESGSLGIRLGNIDASQTITYTFTVSFPSPAGNEFQIKSVIFDIVFPNFPCTHSKLVINEVYYNVQNSHWLPSHGYYWYNLWGKTGCDCNDREHDNYISDNLTGGRCTTGNDGRKNDEWVELYNPSSQDISLKDWTITDNFSSVTIHANKKIKAHGFALITKDSDTWRFWNENRDALKVETGKQFGNGLDNLGDHLILKNNNGIEIDRMSWGTDTSGFTPNAVNPVVPRGDSTERISTGFDTNKASDWTPRKTPTPGN